MNRIALSTVALLALGAVLAVQTIEGQTGNQPQPRPGEGQMRTIKLDGDWTVAYVEMEGKPAEAKEFTHVTIRNNVVTCQHGGKERKWHLQFGPHNMVRCNEEIDGKTTSTSTGADATNRTQTAVRPHTHFGVYIASQDLFCIGMNKGMDNRFGSSRGGDQVQQAQAQPGAQGQQGEQLRNPGFGSGEQNPHGSQFVLVLHRSGATTGVGQIR